MDEDTRRRALELRQEIDCHPARAVHSRWELFSLAYRRVFLVNDAELLSLLRLEGLPEDAHIELVQNVAPPTFREWYTGELYRRLHNWLAARKTIVDQARRLTKPYESTHPEFTKELRTKIERVSRQPAAAVVEGLRNYLLHRALPGIGYTVFIDHERGGVEVPVIWLDAGELLEWPNWRAGARSYLSQAVDGRLAIEQVITDQSSEFAGIQTWVLQQFEVLHGHEMDAYDALVTSFHELIGWRGQPEGRGEPPR